MTECWLCGKDLSEDEDYHTCNEGDDAHDYCEDCCPICNEDSNFPIEYYMGVYITEL